MTERFFSVIRAGLEIDTISLVLEDEELSDLVALAKRQNVLPVFYHGLQQCCLSKNAIDTVKAGCNESIYRFVRQDETLRKIKEALDSEDIPYLPLKGAVLRPLYPQPWQRTSSDIDILVHTEDLQHAVDILTQNEGFSLGKETGHDVSLFDYGVHLELHFRLTEDSEAGILDDVWKHSRKVVSGSCHEMEPDYLVLYLLAHMSRHFKATGLGVRPILDVYLLLQKTECNEKRLLELCCEAHLQKFYEAIKMLIQVWFEGREHTPLTRTLEKYVLGGGVFGSSQTAVFARKRALGSNKKPAWNYYIRRMFLPREEMRKRFPELKTKPWMLPLCYGKRVLCGLTNKRRAVKAEFRTAQEKKEESIEFSELLDNLEL